MAISKSGRWSWRMTELEMARLCVMTRKGSGVSIIGDRCSIGEESWIKQGSHWVKVREVV